MEGTKRAILERLLRQDRHVLAVAHELRIRESAIRRHFDQLENLGYVRGYFRQEGLGRPKRYYEITTRGREAFPGPYVERLRGALEAIMAAGRASRLDNAVQVLVADIVRAHGARFRRADTPLAKARALEFVMAEVGFVVRARVEAEAIKLDCTSTIIVTRALGRSTAPSDEWKRSLLGSIISNIDWANGVAVEPGEQLCPPPQIEA